MSLFSNEVRVANTATPSFTQAPNVSQYGWTEVDHGRFNQLIQYVDLCRDYSEHIDSVSFYVERLANYVKEMEPQIESVVGSIDTVKTYQRIVEADKNTVNGYKNEVVALKADFDPKYQKFISEREVREIEISFEAGWEGFGGVTYVKPRAVVCGEFVKFQGLVQRASGTSRKIGRILAPYNPNGSHIFLTASAGGFVGIEIDIMGDISVRAQEGGASESFPSWVSLEGISYYIHEHV